MNKQGKFNFSTFINTAFLFGIMLFVIFWIVGFSGGFSILSNVTKFIAGLPTWVLVVFFVVMLFSIIRD